MPATLNDALTAIAFSVRSGVSFTRMDVLRRSALAACGVPDPSGYSVQKLPAEGRGNLGLYVIRKGAQAVFQKVSLNSREYQVAQTIADGPGTARLPAIYLCAARGPVLHVFQEFVPDPAPPVSPQEFATVASDVSRFATAQLGAVAASRLFWFDKLVTDDFLRSLAGATGQEVAPLRAILGQVLTLPRAIVHNDLHSGNIRRRADGTPVAIDLGGLGWALQGSEFHSLLPKPLTPDADLGPFDAATSHAADRLDAHPENLRRAAFAYGAARQYRRARHRRDPALLAQSMALATRLV